MLNSVFAAVGHIKFQLEGHYRQDEPPLCAVVPVTLKPLAYLVGGRHHLPLGRPTVCPSTIAAVRSRVNRKR
ncbi:hypothetical protein Aau02nite_71000 [Amorphoplanes auranticolor]|uniref:Uncharacterized protein n=1 Tax=Actinoplanes auranticolor TaxID=47988 RepID=A0A919VTX8_9ACTN|nr:hypothetical protein Aau02nite_71000 [Actinoplanes auranticolor]